LKSGNANKKEWKAVNKRNTEWTTQGNFSTPNIFKDYPSPEISFPRYTLFKYFQR
jgi:hypothetical protein